MRITEDFLQHMFAGTESVGFDLDMLTPGTESASFNKAVSALSRKFNPQTINSLMGIINSYKKPKVDGRGIIDNSAVERLYNVNLTEGIESAAKDYLTKKFNQLPEEVKEMVRPINARVNSLRQTLAGCEAGTFNYDATAWNLADAEKLGEKILFGIFAGVEDQRRLGNIDDYGTATPKNAFMMDVNGGTESGVGTYQNTIYYPVFNTSLQWLNSASPIYTKVIRVKELANEFSGIPIETKKYIYDFVDETEAVIKSVPREKLFAKFSPDDVPEAYQQNLKYLKLTEKDFNKEINLWRTPVEGHNGQTFLKPLEHIRSDFYIYNLKMKDVEQVLPKVYDYRSGKVLTESMHEVERKGKTFDIMPDPTKADEIYSLTVYFDATENILKTYYVKSKPEMKDLEYITFEFKGNDADFVYHSNMRPRTKNEVTYLEAGAEIRNDIPTNINQYNVINSRTGGNYLQEMLNMQAEYILNHKEKIFMDGWEEVLRVLREREELAVATNNPKINEEDLYTAMPIDVRIDDTNRKVEYIDLKLGPSFTAMKRKLSQKAYAKTEVQLTMFGHSLSLGVLGNDIKMISGVINEETNGKYLGVDPQVRAYAYTVGTPQTSPVDMIVVASDKDELKAKDRALDGSLLPESEIEYKLFGAPTFAEKNLETLFMTETPIRVTNSADVRSNAQILIPTLISVTHAKFQTIREAAVEVAVKGWHIKLV